MRDLSHVKPFVSKAEMRRMLAREHNRAYEAGETTKKDDLVDSVKAIVKGFEQALLGSPKK